MKELLKNLHLENQDKQDEICMDWLEAIENEEVGGSMTDAAKGELDIVEYNNIYTYARDIGGWEAAICNIVECVLDLDEEEGEWLITQLKERMEIPNNEDEDIHNVDIDGSTTSKQNNLHRAAKIGDLGEGLVAYDFVQKGYEVACVENDAADLICSKEINGEHKRYAISVKTRKFKKDSTVSLMYNLDSAHIDKLNDFCDSSELTPIFSLLVCLNDEKKFYLISVKIDDIPDIFNKTGSEKKPNSKGKIKHGYSIKFSRKHIEELKKNEKVSFSSWENESIGNDCF